MFRGNYSDKNVRGKSKRKDFERDGRLAWEVVISGNCLGGKSPGGISKETIVWGGVVQREII